MVTEILKYLKPSKKELKYYEEIIGNINQSLLKNIHNKIVLEKNLTVLELLDIYISNIIKVKDRDFIQKSFDVLIHYSK